MANVTQKIRTALHNPAYVPSIVWRRLSTKFSYRFSWLLKARSSPPETVNIYPTNRCNLKCSMCFVRLQKPEPEMEIEKWIEIIDQIKTFRPRIHLSGGEPFFYQKISPLTTYIKQNDLFLAITTNGTYLNEYAEEIVNMKVNRINISIDGPKEIHDKIRGVEGTFDRVVDGLKKVAALRGNSRLPEIQIHSMINFADPGVMQWMINFASRLHADAVKFLYPLFVDSEGLKNHSRFLKQTLNRDLNYWRRADVPCVRPRDFTETQHVLDSLKKERHIPFEIFPSFDLDQLKAYYIGNSSFPKNYKGRCQAMWNTATILPSGNIESCPDYILGNCGKEKFISLWNNEIMRALRRRIKNRQFFCVCRACCFFYQ